MSSDATILSITVTIVCIAAACLSLIASYQLMKPRPASTAEKSSIRPFAGALLLASAIPWTLLGINASESASTDANPLASVEDIEGLPTTSAGIAPSFEEIQISDSVLYEARAITAAEEIAEEPKNPDFQKFRNHVTQLLFNAEGFSSSDSAILIDLSQDSHKEMIKYLADERPGLLTIIYHKQYDSGSKMIVYFPEIAGNQLIYTPLAGPASNSLSKVSVQNPDSE